MSHKILLRSAVFLGGFALVGVGLVALVHQVTAPLIAQNEHLSLLKRLESLVPASVVDNDMVNDSLTVQNKALLGDDSNIMYRGRKHGQPVAAIIDPMIPNGYAGPIKLLVAASSDGVLKGVRVVSHKETPGLGDLIEEQKSSWIFQFDGKSLQNPPLSAWGVKRDGGAFDQLTGATITSRAVVKAVKNTLVFVKQQGTSLYNNAVDNKTVNNKTVTN